MYPGAVSLTPLAVIQYTGAPLAASTYPAPFVCPARAQPPHVHSNANLIILIIPLPNRGGWLDRRQKRHKDRR